MRHKKSPKRTLKPARTSTTATHVSLSDGSAHAVGIGNLRVLIIKDDDAWFAQGLEIDYATQGESLVDVKRQFEQGLGATIQENLRRFGHFENLLRSAPQEVWQGALTGAVEQRYHYSYSHFLVASFVKKDAASQSFPFTGINYLQERTAASV